MKSHLNWSVILSTALFFCLLIESEAELASPINFPYVVKIYYDPLPDNEEGKPIKCSGVIYNENYVITSARCAEPTLKRVEGAATHDYADFLAGAGAIARNCKPTDYNLFRYGVDAKAISTSGAKLSSTSEKTALDEGVAIIKTNKPWVFSRSTRACEVGNETVCKKDGDSPFLLGGWEEEKKNKLHKLMLEALKEDDCKGKFPKFDGKTQECAKSTKGGKEVSRESDQGAPLVKLVKVFLAQAPVDLFKSVMCGVLTNPSEKESDYYQKQTKILVDWFKANAGPQKDADFMPLE